MDSNLYVAQNIKLDKNYTNVVNYTKEQMLELVRNKSVYESNNLNYLDYMSNTIKVDCEYKTVIESNYIAFRNPRHGDKWYFAFIDDVKYEAPKQCTIFFTIDVWSTFFSDWNLKTCFVVREHVNDDTVGKHTVPENVTTGEYVIQAHLRDSYNRGTQKVIVASNIEPSDGNKVFGGCYNGVPTGFRYFAYDYTPAGISNVARHIELCQSRDGDISQLFIAPMWIAGDSVLIVDTETAVSQTLGVSKITDLQGYVPKNKKLLTWPYCYILASNGQGQDAILHQELWELIDNEMKLTMEGCLTAGCSVRLIPKKYNNDERASSYGINLGKFPQVSWSTDPYINWLTENGVNVVTQLASTIGQIATGDVVGGIANGLNTANQINIASQCPPQVKGNTNAGDVNWVTKENCFHIFKMTIKSEFAKQIDDYWSRFGYKIDETKIPNITGRRYWNFLEIGPDEIIGTGSVPSKYMEEINNICRKGVTIWHVHDNIGNFTLNNEII